MTDEVKQMLATPSKSMFSQPQGPKEVAMKGLLMDVLPRYWTKEESSELREALFANYK